MNKMIVKKLGIWTLAISLFAFHVLFRSVAYAETAPSWNKTFATSGECHISFPSTPQIIQQQVPLAGGAGHLSYDVYLAPNADRGVFLLLIATYPTAMSEGNELAGLEGLLNGIVNNHVDNSLVYANVIDHLGHVAVDFLVEGGNNYFRGKAMMVGNKLYLVAMEGLKTNIEEAVFTKFFNSFKLDGN